MSTSMVSQLGSNGGGGAEPVTVGADNISNQLAGMSKHQLYQIVSQMKDLIQQNQQQARQILIANPQLTKTLFQAQVMLGMVRAPETSPLATMPAQVPPQPTPPAQTQDPQVPPAPPSIPASQPVLSHQQAPEPGPSQMGSPYLQHTQVPSASVPAVQSFAYQQPMQPSLQSSPPTTTWLSHSQALPAVTPAPPLPLPLPQQQPHGPTSQPPPLPQQPRPVVPSTQLPSSQFQQQNTQSMGFLPHAGPQAYLPPQPPFQQQGAPLHSNSALSFQQMPPPLPPQPPPQHLFQVPQSRGDAGVNMGQATMLPMGSTMGVPAAPTWNQTVPSSGSGVALHVPQAGMVPGHHAYAPSGGAPAYQGYNQAMLQPPPQPPQQQLPQQPQMQTPIELEQQKALLQQVMNLTPEQINSLPPEQRQQVLQLQQAFRSQTG